MQGMANARCVLCSLIFIQELDRASAHPLWDTLPQPAADNFHVAIMCGFTEDKHQDLSPLRREEVIRDNLSLPATCQTSLGL